MSKNDRELQDLIGSMHRAMYELRHQFSPELKSLNQKSFRQVMLWVHAVLAWDQGAPETLATLIQFEVIPVPVRGPVAQIVAGWRKPEQQRKGPKGELRAVLMQALWLNTKFYDHEKTMTECVAEKLEMNPPEAQKEINRQRQENLNRILDVTGSLEERQREKLREKMKIFYNDLGVTAPNPQI
ncbi:hypothetical protein [Microbulbifer sp.]|uniref:hypothetical protein n=1 Tax=Microbulbifer sp. TaxID=1908541 RepID=UPI0025853FC8|nr:hypothetical protein [Microbulbifer sp.]